jgi:hypothetical protein
MSRFLLSWPQGQCVLLQAPDGGNVFSSDKPGTGRRTGPAVGSRVGDGDAAGRRPYAQAE